MTAINTTALDRDVPPEEALERLKRNWRILSSRWMTLLSSPSPINEASSIGMSQEIQSRIFEPFFTKDMSKGTGLGLSTALTIVKSHGGFINVYSELHKGSVFALYIPVTRRARAIPPCYKPTCRWAMENLFLVVDDVESIREITRGTLETFGYKVVTASDGTETLAIYADRKNEVAVVLTDMVSLLWMAQRPLAHCKE